MLYPLSYRGPAGDYRVSEGRGPAGSGSPLAGIRPPGCNFRPPSFFVGRVPNVISRKGRVPGRALLLIAAVVLLGTSLLAAPSGAAARSVHFEGRTVEVPQGLAGLPARASTRGMCVRLDRRAVYLGTPAPNQRCPADAIGRRRAILVEPPAPARAASASRARRAPRAPPRPASRLHRARLRRLHRALLALDGRLGATSPYRAIGVYIGGINRACSQPNLTSELGRRADRSRLAPDPDLRRPAGADQRLLQLRQAELQRRRPPRERPRRSTPSPRRGAIGDRPRQPDLLRHGVLRADLERHRRHPHLPRGLDRRSCTRSATSPASTAAAPRGSPTWPARSAPATRSPTTSGSPTGTARRTPPTRSSPRAPGPPPAHPPVPRRP